MTRREKPRTKVPNPFQDKLSVTWDPSNRLSILKILTFLNSSTDWELNCSIIGLWKIWWSKLETTAGNKKTAFLSFMAYRDAWTSQLLHPSSVFNQQLNIFKPLPASMPAVVISSFFLTSTHVSHTTLPPLPPQLPPLLIRNWHYIRPTEPAKINQHNPLFKQTNKKAIKQKIAWFSLIWNCLAR